MPKTRTNGRLLEKCRRGIEGFDDITFGGLPIVFGDLSNTEKVLVALDLKTEGA